MKRALCLVIGIFFCAAFAVAAEQTWIGRVSDSDCGQSHKSAIEHSGKKMGDHDCVAACIKDHKAKYVFVSEAKIYKISNQDLAGLSEHAGHTIKLTGEMTGDTIKVSKMERTRGPVKKGSQKKA